MSELIHFLADTLILAVLILGNLIWYGVILFIIVVVGYVIYISLKLVYEFLLWKLGRGKYNRRNWR